VPPPLESREDSAALQKTEPDKNGVMANQDTNDAAFILIEPGLARKRNGNRIYARVRLAGKCTWKSTKTDDPELARKWKKKWEEKQWLQRQGYIAKEETEPASGKPPTADGGQSGSSPEAASSKSPPVTINQIIDNYVAAGHPTVKKRKLKRKSPRSVENETYTLPPLRVYFGGKIAEQLTLGDCDAFHVWRCNGGYVAKFMCRGKPIQKKAQGGDRAVDLNLIVLSNALEFAMRQGVLKSNPIRDRGRYADDSTVRHCREVAPTPDGLVRIANWMGGKGFGQDADITRYLAYSGLRLNEGLNARWSQVDWAEELIHVKRSKRGVFPFVLILPELAQLLRRMKTKAKSDLLFPSPFDKAAPRDDSSYRRRLGQAAAACGLTHVTPQGLRSYFVTQARQSGLTDAEIAQLIGDKTGPTLIAEVYGDVRPDHLLAVARKIQLTARTRNPAAAGMHSKSKERTP
jgi:integrase